MGSPFAPSFANLYMAFFEEMYIYNNNIFKNNIVVWKRFLDDVWVLWQGRVDQLKTSFNYLNNCSDFFHHGF